MGDHLRDADNMELEAILELTGVDALLFSLAHSDESYTVVDEDGPSIMFGLSATTQPTVGAIWMLSTERIHNYPRTFLKFSRRWVDFFNKKYPVLTNVVDLRNRVHIEWLRWLKCDFIDQIKVGPNDTPFVQFVRNATCATPQ